MRRPGVTIRVGTVEGRDGAVPSRAALEAALASVAARVRSGEITVAEVAAATRRAIEGAGAPGGDR